MTGGSTKKAGGRPSVVGALIPLALASSIGQHTQPILRAVRTTARLFFVVFACDFGLNPTARIPVDRAGPDLAGRSSPVVEENR